MNGLPAALRYLAATALIVLAALATAAAILVGSAYGAAPEQFAAYNVCKGLVGNLGFSYRAADGAFLIRCPGETQARIIIQNCRGSLSFDASYNVIVTCPDGRAIPIIRGAYPR